MSNIPIFTNALKMTLYSEIVWHISDILQYVLQVTTESQQQIDEEAARWKEKTFERFSEQSSQLVWSFESQSRVKVKVVKWCRKKWFDHNQMYIYHKQCEILQKNHRNSSNIQFQWFPIEKGRKLCKRKRWNGWSKSLLLENKVVWFKL